MFLHPCCEADEVKLEVVAGNSDCTLCDGFKAYAACFWVFVIWGVVRVG